MYYAYALRSLTRNYIYVGLTDDLNKRVHQHNKGWNRTTRAYAPFVLIYSQTFETRAEARKMEKYLTVHFENRIVIRFFAF
ncbi:MAG TPA: GIY-YIG nuclease family protein [Chryseosolibacter sp.]